jgi:hypothetical protein
MNTNSIQTQTSTTRSDFMNISIQEPIVGTNEDNIRIIRNSYISIVVLILILIPVILDHNVENIYTIKNIIIVLYVFVIFLLIISLIIWNNRRHIR